MLSQENIENLKFNAYYKSEPNVKYRGSLHKHNLLHCCNWVFTVVEYDGEYFMKDTYWGTCSDSVTIKITDENIDEFKFVDYIENLVKIEKWEWDNYTDEDCIRLATDSGGWKFAHYYKYKGKKPNAELILQNIDEEIQQAEWNLESLYRKRKEVLDGTHYLLRS